MKIGCVKSFEKSYAKLNASLNAVGFYQSAGYEVVDRTTQHLADESLMECYEMHKELHVAA